MQREDTIPHRFNGAAWVGPEETIARAANRISARASTNADFLKGTLEPKAHHVTPPNMGHDSSFSQQITARGSLVVKYPNTQTGLYFENCDQRKGMLLWLPTRGVASLWRMAFVPPETISYPRGAPFPNTLDFGITQTTITPSNIHTLNFASELAIPYAPDAARVLQNTPLAEDFSRTRAYSGRVSVYSDTVSIGNITLSGELACGAVADTRDVCQSPQGAYMPIDIATKSITAKDGIANTSITSGIVSLMGPDITVGFTAPLQDSIDHVHGEFLTINHSWPGVSAPINTSTPVAGLVTILSSYWISPWAGCTVGGIGGIAILPVPPINECGVLDIDLNMNLRMVQMINGSYSTVAIRAIATHVFAQMDADGWIQYNCAYEDQPILEGTSGWSAGVANTYTQAKCSFRPKMYNQGFDVTGKYIGTAIELYGIITEGKTGGTSADAQIDWNNTTTTFNVRARDLYKQGEVGPARVIRWDSLGDKQTVRVDGVVNVECVPQGNIATYVQDQAASARTCMDPAIYPLLSEIYDGNSDLRRNWEGDDYKTMIRQLLPDWSPGKIAGLLDYSSSANAAAGMEAAGLFGGLLGGVGNAIGGLADDFLSGGQFAQGHGYPAGMPFASAGQFAGHRRARM